MRTQYLLSRLWVGWLCFLQAWDSGVAWQRQSPFDMASTPTAACGCDCCVSQRSRETNAPAANAQSLVACMPRASALVPGGGAAQESADGGCSGICTVPEESWANFQSRTGEVDYTRYCLESCRPATKDMNELCADLDSAAVAPPIALAASSANVSRKAAQPLDADEGAAAIVLAKGEMERAKAQAQAAGMAAKVARQSYEHVIATSQFLAVAAANETVEDIKRAAGEQAREALQMRLEYEKASKMKGLLVAANITATYQQKQKHLIDLARQWEDISKEFDASAEASLAAEEDIELGPKPTTWEARLRNTIQIEEAKAESAAFTDKASNARANAERLRQMGVFDTKAVYTAAKNAMAKSMPPDVAPPPLPEPMPTAPPA